MSLTICLIVLIGCVPIRASAIESDAMPYYNNVSFQNTFFDIDENGNACVKVSYTGQNGVTTGATIKTKIEKRFLLVFWSDIASWTDEVSGYYYTNEHSTTVKKGTYRATVEYTIRGTGGEPDVFVDELEYTYK